MTLLILLSVLLSFCLIVSDQQVLSLETLCWSHHDNPAHSAFSPNHTHSTIRICHFIGFLLGLSLFYLGHPILCSMNYDRSKSWVRFPGWCTTFISQILLSQLVLNPLVYYQVKWFGQYSNILVIDYYLPESGRAEMLLPWLQRHHSWGKQPQKSWWRQQSTTIVDITAESVEA